MTRKIGDKLTDKNGLMVKIIPDNRTVIDCVYNDLFECEGVINDGNDLGCFDGCFIFVEDK